MIGKISANVVNFFNKNFWFYLLILSILLVISFKGIYKLKLNDDINLIFPENTEFIKYKEILNENQKNNLVVFSINSENKSIDKVYIQLDSITKLIHDKNKEHLTNLKYQRNDVKNDFIGNYYSIYPSLIGPADYKDIREKISKDSIKEKLKNLSSSLSNVNNFFIKNILIKDPLGIAINDLKLLNNNSSSFKMEDGILFSKNKKRAFFTAEIKDLESPDYFEAFKKLDESLKDINSNDLNINYFNVHQISLENAEQVKKDTHLTLTISILVIIIIIIIFFKNFITPILFFVTAIFSWIYGMGIVGYLNPNISIISLAISAILIGIVLDYSFHLFSHFKDSGDIIKTIKSISSPLIIGSFTTIAGFAALMFTNSKILQDFGLIAISILFSAALFTLFFIPSLVYKLNIKSSNNNNKEITRTFPKVLTRLSFWTVAILTVFFLFKSNNISFDENLNNLSYHSEKLKQNETEFTGLNPDKEKKIYLFSKGDTKEDALATNLKLYKKLIDYKKNHPLLEISSIAPIISSKDELSNGYKKWSDFWLKNKTNTLKEISIIGEEYDFSNHAFKDFESWISNDSVIVNEHIQTKLTQELGLSNIIYNTGSEWNIITTCVYEKASLKDIKLIANSIENVFLFEISEMINTLINSVHEDFIFLLFVSSAIVFFSLLLIYGRIELALFTFSPMLISWIWILGLASILNIQFNFVNIIIATLIFGLGDDFSIFITDGLLKKYKHKNASLRPYKLAITLSGLTTIIGIGSLFFAKHPAINSIALISVIGISCILLVTLYVQPTIFNFFVINRVKNKKSPIRLLYLSSSILLFIYFAVGCILLNVLLIFIYFTPINREKKRKFLTYIISKYSKSIIYSGFHIKKKIINKEKLNFNKPSIIIANHSSFLDILLLLMLNPKTMIMVKKWVYNSPFFGPFIRYSGYLFIEDGIENSIKKIEARINEGYSIIIYPEGSRSVDGEIQRFHKGAFHIAKSLNIEIQPILILGANEVNQKNDFIINNGTLLIYVMDRIVIKENDDIRNISKEIKTKMVLKKKYLHEKHVNTKWLKRRILNNFLYKDPIAEWYIKIKWTFEKDNYFFYDQLIAERKRIYDMGCGYGYLSLYLHYRNQSRNITGVDYDKDKILVAENSFDKTQNLEFIQNDLSLLNINNADVFLFNDVLHYMNPEKQLKVLNNALENLNPNGVILIRDGVKDLEKRHEKTKLTEYFSTKLFDFNKTENALSFFSINTIEKFAEKNSLLLKTVEQSKKTSNILFILRRND